MMQCKQTILAPMLHHILVPMHQRGNAFIDALASSPLHRMLERPPMYSHAGAWEQESSGGNYACI